MDPSDPVMDLSDPRVPERVKKFALKRSLSERIARWRAEAEKLPPDYEKPPLAYREKAGLLMAIGDCEKFLEDENFDGLARAATSMELTLVLATQKAEERAAKATSAKGGHNSAQGRQAEAQERKSEARQKAARLLKGGKDRREIAAIIAKDEYGWRPRTIRRHLSRYPMGPRKAP